MNSTNLYIALFHGRDHPDEQLSDWGFDGPVIGPVGVTYTYGDIKLHNTEWDDHDELKFENGCVALDGKFYGDFEIVVDDDQKFVLLRSNRLLLTFEQFKELNHKPEEGTDDPSRTPNPPLLP